MAGRCRRPLQAKLLSLVTPALGDEYMVRRYTAVLPAKRPEGASGPAGRAAVAAAVAVASRDEEVEDEEPDKEHGPYAARNRQRRARKRMRLEAAAEVPSVAFRREVACPDDLVPFADVAQRLDGTRHQREVRACVCG